MYDRQTTLDATGIILASVPTYGGFIALVSLSHDGRLSPGE